MGIPPFTGPALIPSSTGLDHCPRASPAVQGPFDPDVGHYDWLLRTGPDHFAPRLGHRLCSGETLEHKELRGVRFMGKNKSTEAQTLNRIGGSPSHFPANQRERLSF